MIPAGNLNQRIVIERPVTTRQASGQRVTDSWQPIHSRQLPASYQPVSGGETVRGMQMVATTKALFTVRWLPGVDTTCRVRWITGATSAANAPVLYLSAVDDPDGLRAVLALQARAAE